MISVEVDGIEYRFFDHLYAVSHCGKVLRKLESYQPSVRPDGYLCLGRHRLMHRVVAACWLDKPESSNHVHHINGDKSDNRADNLEWVTPKQHMGDKHRTTVGRYVRSDETRQKMREIMTGRTYSEETLVKMRTHLDKVRPKRPCRCNGVDYPSVLAASRATGVHPATFRLRCHSKNFPEYEFTS